VIQRAADENVADMPRPQILRHRRQAEAGVYLALGK